MDKKPSFPSKACPKCGVLIHARSHSHPVCGWVMDGKPAAPAAAKPSAKAKKAAHAKPARAASGAGTVTIQDIEAVKAVVARIGADKVRELAKVLAD